MDINFKKYTDDNTFSLSISDLMAALLLIFVLLLSATLLKVEEKKNKKEEIKAKIIEQLKIQMEKNNITIDINPETGAITVEENILFDTDMYLLKVNGKEFLDKFIPIYSKVLLSDDEIKKHLAQIIIEGHADSRGSYESNLKLSLERAYSVASYIFLSNVEIYDRENFQLLLTANGRSYSEPRLPNKNLDNMEKNRRVEIEFRLSDWDLETESIINTIKEKIN